MTTKAEALLAQTEKHDADQASFAHKAVGRITAMVEVLARDLGYPAEVEHEEIGDLLDEETEEGDHGTLISRAGCHFSISIKIGEYTLLFNSSLFPVGDSLHVRIDERDQSAINVSDAGQLNMWSKWMTDEWIPGQFQDTIAGAISKRMNP
jgi:hypothetical protein